MTDIYSRQAAKFVPECRTKILFIAEAPPNSIDRYFYFEKVSTSDWLWIGLMKSLYGDEWSKTSDERKRKEWWLTKFQRDGYRLIDAVKTPIAGPPHMREMLIKEQKDPIRAKIKSISPDSIVLIKKTVHNALYSDLKAAGMNVINEIALPFPSNGHQGKFASIFADLRLGR